MHFPTALTRQKSSDSFGPRRTTPWIASPLAQGASEQGSEHGETKSHIAERVIEFEESQHALHRSRTGHGEPVFREHHESSTVELFYDLFFVANLATFTANHEIVDTASLKNYLGFFTLLWFTWLQYSLFDVRFSTDSVFNRVCKAVSFGVMTGFAVCGAIYDQTNVEENANAFRAMALILLVSRLALVVQYGVVYFYVRKYKKTTWPLLLTMLALFVGAMVYLGTLFGFPAHAAAEASFPIEHGGSKTYAAWYALACLEALAVIAVSCYWRVVSFRHTHLVERIGLLTLIIMGEGIIGMTKSVSTILQTSTKVSSSDIGTIVAAVLLVYFIWVLYFDQIEHDRFGTIRQQIWAVLHFPLHVAILLTVEGSTTLILWNIIKDLSIWLLDNLPCPAYGDYPTLGYDSAEALVSYINETIISFNDNFKNSNISATYDYNADLIALKNISAPYNSSDWYDEAYLIENKIFFSVYDFLFEQFNVEAPESEAGTNTGTSTLDVATAKIEQSASLFNIFNTVFYYFFISAGAFLLILAVMYWFGKTHKSRGEYMSIGVRMVAGCAVMVGLIAGTDLTIAVNFDFSSWIIPTVTLSYFVVIVMDSLLVWHSNKTIARQTSSNRHEVYSKVDGSVQQQRNDSESFAAGQSV